MRNHAYITSSSRDFLYPGFHSPFFGLIVRYTSIFIEMAIEININAKYSEVNYLIDNTMEIDNFIHYIYIFTQPLRTSRMLHLVNI